MFHCILCGQAANKMKKGTLQLECTFHLVDLCVPAVSVLIPWVLFARGAEDDAVCPASTDGGMVKRSLFMHYAC